MSRDRGFSLLEVLFATTIVTVGLAAVAQLFALSTRANAVARMATFATVLAEQKMEQLRGLTWGFDSVGLPLTDTTTDITVLPEINTGGKGLSPSPGGSLTQNISGYCDFLERTGLSLGGGTVPPAGTVFIRRWSIEPLPANPSNTLILQVLVTHRRGADDTRGVNRLPDEARIVSVKTRKGW